MLPKIHKKKPCAFIVGVQPSIDSSTVTVRVCSDNSQCVTPPTGERWPCQHGYRADAHLHADALGCAVRAEQVIDDRQRQRGDTAIGDPKNQHHADQGRKCRRKRDADGGDTQEEERSLSTVCNNVNCYVTDEQTNELLLFIESVLILPCGLIWLAL